ncbi:MAG: recombination mediator RecR [Candidatus Babeliales bacterium]|nr:recombination mediator RecR [Candidatus Babeliales bacterium]
MVDQLPSLKHLLRNLQQVPYLASKNLYRVANHFLSLEDQKLEQFCAAILAAKKNIIRCQQCFIWQEREGKCLYCASLKRDQSIICVVDSWQELMAIEKSGGYQGVYHVLGGVICPLEGIGPENLTIEQLVHRVQTTGTKEIILAMNQTPEGEATSSYIAHKLKNTTVSISCLARGVPVGSSLEFMDRVTLYQAMSDRRPF